MKYKKIPTEYFITILDRLTRFEPASVRFKRVFEDVVSKYLIDKTKNIDINQTAVDIINFSCDSTIDDFFINDVLIDLEKKYFEYDEVSYQYLSYRINFSSIIHQISNFENLPKNVEWLKNINKNFSIYKIRKDNGLLYPLEKIILCEGQTEYVLLNSILKLFNLDLDKEGIIVIQAGGKNQVARKFYNMVEYCKLPFYVLLDKDAVQTKDLILPKLRSKDFIYVLNSGEFEDIIPISLLKKTINYFHSSEQNCIDEDFSLKNTMVENLEFIYKKYGFGDFKKAHFAQSLKEIIDQFATCNDFIDSEINNIVTTLQQDLKNIK